MTTLGIDIGGSGIKGALVNPITGEVLTERFRIETPPQATPEQVVPILKEIVAHFDYEGKIGLTVPCFVPNGTVKAVGNLSDDWKGVQVNSYFSEAIGQPIVALNDADAAGVAELHFGAAKDEQGKVLLLTFGTGIGSAYFIDGKLIPDTEFGHIEFKGDRVERYAADSVRKKLNLSWSDWGKRVNEALHYFELLFSPRIFIIGGGASKRLDLFKDELTVSAQIVPATLENFAGIVGAAYQAYQN